MLQTIQDMRYFLQWDHRGIATSFMGLLYGSLRRNSSVYGWWWPWDDDQLPAIHRNHRARVSSARTVRPWIVNKAANAHDHVRRPIQLLLIGWPSLTCSPSHLIPSPVQKSHQERIARCARNVIIVPNVVVSSDNLAAVGVGDLDMTLTTVGITEEKRENMTVIEAVENGRRVLYCTTSKSPIPTLHFQQ